MKKTLLTLTLLCVALTIHALDYRRVIFGNAYENILEVDANSFFVENTEVKNEADFYRVYEQKIGSKTFYRVLAMDKNYTDTMLLDWKNVRFTQNLYVEQSGKLNILVKEISFCEKREPYWNEYTFGGIEIIERNNSVIGIMEFYNEDYDSRLSTRYYRWEDILKNNGIVYTFDSIQSYGQEGERAKGALVDDRRPLMYTIQNAFDGDPTTSFVNYGKTIKVEKRRLGKGGPEGNNLPLPKLEGIMVINGYASGEYYYQNNQIAEMSINDNYLYLEDSLKPQVMMLQRDADEGKEDDYRYYAHIEKLVKGTKYNDTALGEIDFYLEGQGWLFGFADEENAVDLSTVNTVDGLRYDFTDNTATVITYNGSDTEITIPSEVVNNGKTYTVTAIGDKVFENNEKITKVVLPNGVEKIGKEVFAYCKNLAEVQMADNIVEIGQGAFRYTNLEMIHIPTRVTTIEAGVFNGTNITTIDIPNGVTRIRNAAFRDCKNLTSITIPESVDSIHSYSFAGCENLEKMTFLSKEVDIYSDIFRYPDTAMEVNNVTFYVYKNSTAHNFATINDIPYILIDE